MNHKEIWILCLLLFFYHVDSKYKQGCECGLKKAKFGAWSRCMETAAFANKVFR